MTRPARIAALLCAALLLVTAWPGALALHAQTQPATGPATQPGVRFTYVDVYIDSQDKPLAAYQVEFRADSEDATLVGIEGGEHAAFKQPPYYDPAALHRNRVILAALNTGNDLPTGKTRVARLHLRLGRGAEPHCEVRLVTAASADGKPLAATTASVWQGEHP